MRGYQLTIRFSDFLVLTKEKYKKVDEKLLTFNLILWIGTCWMSSQLYLQFASLNTCWMRADSPPPYDRNQYHVRVGIWTEVCTHISFSGSHPVFCLLWICFGCWLALCWCAWFLLLYFCLKMSQDKNKWISSHLESRSWHTRFQIPRSTKFYSDIFADISFLWKLQCEINCPELLEGVEKNQHQKC